MLCKQKLLDHYKFPRNTAILERHTVASGVLNPSCGDKVETAMALEDSVVVGISMRVQGCTLSIAAASILSEHIKGKEVLYIQQYTTDQLQELLGGSLGPMRLECASLPLKALKKACSLLNS